MNINGIHKKEFPENEGEFLDWLDKDAEIFNKNVSLIPYYDSIEHTTVYKTNITAQWTIYDIHLDINMLLHAIIRNNVDGFILNELTPYMFRKDVPLFFSLHGIEYSIVIHTKQIKTREIGMSDDNTFMDDIYEDEKEVYSVSILAEGVKDEYILTTLKRAIGASLIKFVASETDAESPQEKLMVIYDDLLGESYTPEFAWSTKSSNKLRQLQSNAPDMFPNGYAKACQENNQGLVIPDYKLKEWVESGRKYITYPKEARPGVTQVNYGCPDPKYPHPGLKLNIRLKNNDIYPELPCCYAKDPSKKEKSIYSIYMSGKSKTTDVNVLMSKSKGKPMNTVNKLLYDYKKGNLPRLLVDNFAKKGITNHMLRMGIVNSPNSFIHCIFHALEYKEYTSKTDIIEREKVVQLWRKTINNKANYSCILQEMYGYNTDDIYYILANNDKEFSSDLFYRFLECMFDVNIFVFVESPPSSPVRLEIPRNSITHVREPRLKKKTVLIYKHYESVESDEAHYELIYDNTLSRYLHSSSMTRKIYNYFSEVYNCQIVTNNLIHFNIYNSYSIVAFLRNLGFAIAGQYIDTNNKCRGFIVRVPNGEAGSILCMPQQPLNLPVYKDVFSFTASVLDYFDTPSRSNYTLNGDIEGLWYPVGDYELGFYIPLTGKVKTSLSIPEERASNPLVLREINGRFSEHVQHENYLEALLIIISELYRRYSRKIQTEQPDINITANDLKRVFSNDKEIKEAQLREIERVKHLLTFADLFTVKRRVQYTFTLEMIAEVKNASLFEDAVEALLGSGLVDQESNIYFESQEMLENMTYYLEKYLICQPSSFYEQKSDSGSYFLFSNMIEFKIWIESKVKPNYILISASDLEKQLLSIHTDEGGSFVVLNPKPRFYMDPSGVFLIVQNVVYGDLGRAIYVSTIWRNEMRNVGYHTELFLPSSTPHNVYTISGDELIGLNVIPDAVSVIRYKDGSYAALLPLNI
jgi:hypothetical protein